MGRLTIGRGDVHEDRRTSISSDIEDLNGEWAEALLRSPRRLLRGLPCAGRVGRAARYRGERDDGARLVAEGEPTLMAWSSRTATGGSWWAYQCRVDLPPGAEPPV